MMPTASAQKVNSNNTWNTPYLFNSRASREQYQTCLDIAEAQPTIISDNAKEYDEETGMYYYGARYYEPRISLWMSTDPMEEKYPNFSSYCYTANNPVKYIDPDGKIIKDPDKIFYNFKSQIVSNNFFLREAIKNGSVNADMAEQLWSFYDRILDEISVLEKSDQVYNVFLAKTSNEGGLSYDTTTGNIQIAIEENQIGLVGHELAHAYQYEKGEISLIVDNSGYGRLYDITDETNAYNRERALASGVQYFQSPNAIYNGFPFKMNDENVKEFGKSMSPPAYQDLPNNRTNIKSKMGKELRKKTIQVGRLGIPVTEVYNGWQKDYERGQK